MNASINDQFKLTAAEEKFLFKKNLNQLVFIAGQFENLPVSLTKTTSIVNNEMVDNVSPVDVWTIFNLKRAFQYALTRQCAQMTFADVLMINQLVLGGDPTAGKVRTSAVRVKIGDTLWDPLMPNEATVAVIKAIMTAQQSTTAKAITLNLALSRAQLFTDGNKRTAMIAANLLMLQGGAGIFGVPERRLSEYGKKLGDYYRSGQAAELQQWLSETAVFGLKMY